MENDLVFDPQKLGRLMRAVRRWRAMVAVPLERMDDPRLHEMTVCEEEIVAALDELDGAAFLMPIGLVSEYAASERISVQ